MSCDKSFIEQGEGVVLSAKDAAFLTDQAIINNEKIEFNNIMKKIKRQSEKGYNFIILDYISLLNKRKLIELGYKVKEDVTIIGRICEILW